MSFADGTDLLSLATDGTVATAKADMVGVKVLSLSIIVMQEFLR